MRWVLFRNISCKTRIANMKMLQLLLCTALCLSVASEEVDSDAPSTESVSSSFSKEKDRTIIQKIPELPARYVQYFIYFFSIMLTFPLAW